MFKKYGFKAVVFDLDGVITQTALVHSAAWKKMFDGFLKEYYNKHGKPFLEFDHNRDYLPYVDGKPRYQGVASFLESRGIELPWGDPSDPPSFHSMCGLGNLKNETFNEVLEQEGVRVYPSTLELIYQLRKCNIRVGVASSSKNCEEVLKKAGILNLFETRVDGVVSAEMGLKGKPAPDIFIQAAHNLGSPPHRTVVVEDAVSGVQAGRQGNFGLVIGIAREDNEQELMVNGADLVVNDLEALGGIEGIESWFETGLPADQSSLNYHDFVPEKEKHRETLLTIGNGYFGTRGAMEETQADGTHYPATYMAGLYNRLPSTIGDRIVENEDFVNCVNWLPITFRIDQGEWFHPAKAEILEIHRRLNFKTGTLKRTLKVRFEGKTTRIESTRFASMHQPGLAVQTYSLTPLDYSATIEFRAGVDMQLTNEGVERYRSLNQKHLTGHGSQAEGNRGMVWAETVQSNIEIACAFKLSLSHGSRFKNHSEEGRAFAETSCKASQDEKITLTKIIALCNSHTDEDPRKAVLQLLEKTGDLDEIKEMNHTAWNRIWQRCDLNLKGDRLAQKILRLHLYHLFVTTSPHHIHLDAGIPARGLHGEAYRGHIFWDELYILPVYNLSFPEIARSVLMYRYNRLEAAREYARESGNRGAMFPWQSGSSGKEETQVVHLNPVSGKWGEDYSALQRHVSLAIAYNVWEYYHATLDLDFMISYGAELFLDICTFWTGLCEKDESTGKYHIHGVMGPDEFHEKYPDAPKGGLTDNAYSNLMTAWALRKAFAIKDIIGKVPFERLAEKLGITQEEWNRWQDISHNLNLEINPDGIIAQYRGYFDLKELDWDYFRKKYGNVYRMDRLLKAEGLSPDDYKVAKQADTLMIFYNLATEEVNSLLRELGYTLPEDYVLRNLEYYLARTSHGSTLSRIVHAKLARMTGNDTLGWNLYREALTSDYTDIQGGTTAEGIHAGVMAGTLWIALSVYGGLSLRGETPSFEPSLPHSWESLEFNFQYRKVRYYVILEKNRITLTAGADDNARVNVKIKGKDYILKPGIPLGIEI